MIIIDKVIGKIVDRVTAKLEEQLFEKINASKIDELWNESFENAVELSDVFASGFGKELSNHRAMMRYFHATFNPIVSFPNVEDFIFTIGMEFQDFQLKIMPEVTIAFGSAVMKDWTRKLHSNKILRKRMEENKREVQKVEFTTDTSEIKHILKDKNELRKRFFKSYEHSDGYKYVRVWLPRPDETWIRWEKEHSIDIKVNPMIGMDLGFFRVGYDYSLIFNNEDDRLKFAAISSSKTKETGEFKSFNIGERSGEIFWAN